MIVYQNKAARCYARARKCYERHDYQNAAHWQRMAADLWLWAIS